MTNGSIMKVGRIAECSLGAFYNTVDLHLAIIILDPHLNQGVGWRHETGLSPPVKYFTDVPRRFFFCGSFGLLMSCVFMLSHLFITALCSPAGG